MTFFKVKISVSYPTVRPKSRLKSAGLRKNPIDMLQKSGARHTPSPWIKNINFMLKNGKIHQTGIMRYIFRKSIYSVRIK